MTRLGDILGFRQPFKAFGNNYFKCQNHSFFIVIWRILSGHTERTYPISTPKYLYTCNKEIFLEIVRWDFTNRNYSLNDKYKFNKDF